MGEEPIEVVTTDGRVVVYPNGIVEVYEHTINETRFRASNLATVRLAPAERRALARALDEEHYARHDAIMAAAEAVVDVVNGPADSRWLTSLAVTARLLGITLDDEEAIQ